MVELIESSLDVDVSHIQLEEALRAADSMANLSTSVQAIAAEGYLISPLTYSVMKQYSGSLLATVGAVDSNTMSAESFTSAKTVYAAEGLADDAKKMLKKIVDFVNQLFEKIIAFFRNLFINADRLAGIVNELEAKFKDAKGKLKVKPINDDRLCNMLYTGNKTAKPVDGVESIEAILNVADELLYEHSQKIIPETTKFMDEVIRPSNSFEFNFEFMGKKIKNKPKKTLGDLVNEPVADFCKIKDSMNEGQCRKHEVDFSPEFNNYLLSEVLPGNRSLVLQMNNHKEKTKFKLKFVLGTGDVAFNAPSEINSLTEQEINRVLEVVKSILKVLMAIKVKLQSVVTAKNQMMSKASSEFSTACAIGSQGEQSMAFKGLGAIAHLCQSVLEPATMLSSYSVKTCKAYLDLVEKSIHTASEAQ
jgi:hypothetical protein